MALGKYLLAAAAASLAITPAVAASANPAASLSVAKPARAGTKAGKDSQIAGLGGPIIFAVAAVAAVVVAIVLVDDDDDSDSN